MSTDFETALRSVIEELKAPKSEYNSFGKYSYRSAEDVLEAVKPLLSKHSLRLAIDDELLYIGDRYYVKATVYVMGYETSAHVSALAREADTQKGMSDAQITGSASSYARKYALSGMFCIDDNKDADTQDNRATQPKKASSRPIGEQPASSDQKKRIAQMLNDQGILTEQMVDILEEHYGVTPGSIMTSEKAISIIEDLSLPARDTL